MIVRIGPSLFGKFAFVSGAVIEGIVFDITQPLVPRHVDLVINGHDFGAEFACGAVHLQEIGDIGEEALRTLRANIGGADAIAARCRFEISTYVPTDVEHQFELLERSTRTRLFSEKRSLRGDIDAHLMRATGNVVVGRLHVGRVEGRRVYVCGDFIVAGDGSGITAIARPAADFAIERRERSSCGDRIVLDESCCFSLYGEAEIVRDEAFIELADRDGRLTIPRSSGLIIPENFEDELSSWIYPDAPRMQRTMGFAAELSYYFDGYQTVRMLDSLLQEFAGRHLADYLSILDWGCGCGRVTQHLIKNKSATVYGVDIDADNLAWCRAHLAKGIFEQSAPMPPTGFPDESMDLIIGISVFTHLREAAQQAWLSELGRLLAPGGIAMVTIMSEHALFTRWITPAVHRDFIMRGISDGTVGSTLNDVLSGTARDHYRETYQSHDYVLRNWAREFDILGIKRAAHVNFQDVVILRKRADTVSPRIGF